MTRPLRYAPADRAYIAPRGVEPMVYMNMLCAQAESRAREKDFHEAQLLLQKRLAVASYYRGSRTVYAADAMTGLAAMAASMGAPEDALTWAHFAARCYAALLTEGETRNKGQIAQSMAALEKSFPAVRPATSFVPTAAPDFTTGRLVHIADDPTQVRRLKAGY